MSFSLNFGDNLESGISEIVVRVDESKKEEIVKFYNALKLEKGVKEKNKIYFKIGKYAYLAFVFEPNKVYGGNLTLELLTSQLEELKSHLTKKKIPFTDAPLGLTGITVVDPIGNSLVFVD